MTSPLMYTLQDDFNKVSSTDLPAARPDEASRWWGESQGLREHGGGSGLVDPQVGPGSGAAVPPRSIMLDIPTPPVTVFGGSSARIGLSKSSRRLFGRIRSGLLMSGDHYFLTLTSAPGSPDLDRSWDIFKKRLFRQVGRLPYIAARTREGHGVIHCIFRLHDGRRHLDVNKIRSCWFDIHQAKQLVIRYIRDRDIVARYVSDQRVRNGMAGEFCWQDGLVWWRWSPGWLPVGYCEAFPAFWQGVQALEPNTRDKAIRDFLVELQNRTAQQVLPCE